MYTDYGYSEAAGAGMMAAMGVYYLVALVICVIALVAMWKIFVKADEPGWAAIVPFYNNYVLFKIAMGNGWLFLLCLIPVVGSIVALVAYYKLAIAFGKGVGFGIGMIFLTPIFLLLLAFGDAEYEGV